MFSGVTVRTDPLACLFGVAFKHGFPAAWAPEAMHGVLASGAVSRPAAGLSGGNCSREPHCSRTKRPEQLLDCLNSRSDLEDRGAEEVGAVSSWSIALLGLSSKRGVLFAWVHECALGVSPWVCSRMRARVHQQGDRTAWPCSAGSPKSKGSQVREATHVWLCQASY